MEQKGQNLNQYYIEGRDELLEFLVFWLRLTSADSENLLTVRAKHDFYELQYVLSGSIAISANSEVITVSAGEYLLIPPGIYHETVSYEAHTEKLVFGFSVSFLSDELQETAKLLHCCRQKETPVLRALAELLLTVGASMQKLSCVQIRCLTETLLLELFTQIEQMPTPSGNRFKRTDSSYKEETVLRITDIIREHIDQGGITVRELAAQFHMSTRHLSRLCMEITGKTPHKLIDEERIRYLRELLMTSELPLAAIANQMGFSSENAVTRFFRKNEGYTPSQYRKYISQK